MRNYNLLVIGSQTQYLLLGIALFVFGIGVPNYGDLFFVAIAAIVVRYSDLLDWKCWVLFLFSICYAFVDVGELSNLTVGGKISFVVVSIASYLVGKKIFLISKEAPRRAITLFFTIQIGWLLFGVLAIYATVMTDPTLIISRHFISFFFDDIEMHGLYMAACFLIGMASLPFVIYWLLKAAGDLKLHELFVFIMVAVAGVIGGVINNFLQNRSPFVMVIVAALLPLLFLPRKKIASSGFEKSYSLSKLSYFASLMIVVIVAAGILMYLDFGPDDFLSDGKSSRLDREEMSTNGRADVWMLGLEMVPQYPLGGIIMPPGYESTQGFFHNFWLDVAKVSGYVPLMLILVFQIAHARGIIITLLSKYSFESGMFTILFICFAFMYLTEPILQLMPQFYYLSIMVFGYVSMVKNSRSIHPTAIYS